MKKTQKNNLIKVIFVLLVVLLISASLLGRTLARYISSAPLADSTARVAKWGVEVSASGDLFADSYAKTDGTYNGGDTVISGSQDLVVAPGTSGTSGTFTISGTPEVATRVLITDSGSTLIGWDYNVAEEGEDEELYEPVLWTLTQGEAEVLTKGSLADLLNEIEDATYDLAPGTDLSEQDLEFEISWEWPFTGGNDEGDTHYGDKPTAPTIKLALDITVVQID